MEQIRKQQEEKELEILRDMIRLDPFFADRVFFVRISEEKIRRFSYVLRVSSFRVVYDIDRSVFFILHSLTDIAICRCIDVIGCLVFFKKVLSITDEIVQS